MEGDEEMGLFGRKKVIEDEEETDILNIYKMVELQVIAEHIANLATAIYQKVYSNNNIKDEHKEIVYNGAIELCKSALKQ